MGFFLRMIRPGHVSARERLMPVIFAFVGDAVLNGLSDCCI